MHSRILQIYSICGGAIYKIALNLPHGKGWCKCLFYIKFALHANPCENFKLALNWHTTQNYAQIWAFTTFASRHPARIWCKHHVCMVAKVNKDSRISNLQYICTYMCIMLKCDFSSGVRLVWFYLGKERTIFD